MTKGQTLKKLLESNIGIKVLPIYILTMEDFLRDSDNEIKKIIAFSGNKNLIVRSSCRMEDQMMFSNAGKYQSILDVLPCDDKIRKAISQVYDSYHIENEQEEILIQPMVEDVIKSGVIFTADADTNAPYFTINYSESGDTAAVTGGSGRNIKTLIIYKDLPIEIKDMEFAALVEQCRILEDFFGNHSLDIEFAINKKGEIFVLQVRPLALTRKEKYEILELSQALTRINKKVIKLSAPHPFLLGSTTCFGVMPDWNPAEILGARPKKLSISLYKELITDSIWAHQRHNYGYRDLTMHPLMISFCGIPYIDTRITFNSFIPADLNETIAEKLVNYYLERLKESPKYHDKVEFQIVFSCYYFGLGEKLKKLAIYGFNDNEIKRIEFSLLSLTNSIIHPTRGWYKKDIQKIDILQKNYDKIVASDISLIDKIYWLLEECKTYGTLPFAGVARAGFIAIQLLRSLKEIGIITQAEHEKFMNSLNTVNKQLRMDLIKLKTGAISKELFLNKYGHIRPGTYDILSRRYDEDYEFYFGGNLDIKFEKADGKFELSNNKMQLIQRELEQNGLVVSANELFQFLREAIEGREYLKFVFTKSVSKILQLIDQLGKRLQITQEDMAYLDITEVIHLYTDLYFGNPAEVFRANIEKNKIQYKYAQQIKLPSIIVTPDDVYQYFLLEEEPNYVTQKTIVAETVLEANIECESVKGKIVFIQSADPGYDFLFTKDIGGLITEFGGVNSHMAIRCAELGIPAVIGAGEYNYEMWSKYSQLTIECGKRKVTVWDNI